MSHIIATLSDLLTKTGMAVIVSLQHNWIPLSLAILTAAVMKVYVDAKKIERALLRNLSVSIWASVAVGAFTPLCACGTMAVILGMLSTTLPWGPIMAFLTSSPLMSPDGFIMVAGIIRPDFAIALAVASIVIGLAAGYLTHFIEKKTTFLADQTRFASAPQAKTCGCSGAAAQLKPVQAYGCAAVPMPQPVQTCGCAGAAVLTQEMCCAAPLNPVFEFASNIRWREIADAVYTVGIKQILLYYMLFVAIGFVINSTVPTSVLVALFSAKSIFAVPLAALIGLPLYVTTESSIPLIQVLMAGGASSGAMLAFMITGPGTSAWVIAGITTIMKRRAIALYVSFLLMGGILSGYLYDLFLAIK